MRFCQKLILALLAAWATMFFTSCNSSGGGGDWVNSSSSDPATGQASNVQNPAARKKVFLVILENTDSTQALQQPFLSMLAAKGALLGNAHAVGSPSQPNYFALTSGSTWGVTDDGVHTLDVRHIGDLIEEKGLTWKSYAEDYPGGCNLNATVGNYARKHEPFISYKNIQTNPARCANIVNSSQFADDLSSGRMPAFSFYVPNNLNNGHDTGVAYADAWLSKTFSNLISDPQFMKDNLFIVTFDEGSQGNQIYTVLYGDAVVPGSVSSQDSGHYSLLATLEQILGLGSLGQGDSVAPPITAIWK